MVQWLAFKNLNLKLRVSKQHNGVTSTVKRWTWSRRVGVLQRRGSASTLLVDSGVDVHICHPDFAKEFPLKKSAGVTLRDVQGNPLSHHGTRYVNLSVGTRGQRANIDFQIADKSVNMLSLGKLLRNGFVFNLRGENDSIMYHHRDQTTTVPFLLHKNSLGIRANPIVHHVSPVINIDMPVRLSGQSPLRLLDRRLDELALPKHGTKLDKRTRIEKREKELMRERKSQAAIEAEREAGPEGRRREAAIPISDPRELSNTEKEVHELTRLPPQPWCEQCTRGRGAENPHKRVTFERAESTLPVIAFDFCFIKTSGIVRRDRRRRGDLLGVTGRGHWVHEGCTSCWKDRHGLPD